MSDGFAYACIGVMGVGIEGHTTSCLVFGEYGAPTKYLVHDRLFVMGLT